METVECRVCEGQGYLSDICTECNGSGEGLCGEGSTCQSCKGSGESGEICPCCEGEKYVDVDKLIEIAFDSFGE